MKKQNKIFNFSLFLFFLMIATIFMGLTRSIFAEDIKDVMINVLKLPDPQKAQKILNDLGNAINTFNEVKQKFQEETKKITPDDAINILSTTFNIPSPVKEVLIKIKDLAQSNKPTSSQPSQLPQTSSGALIQQFHQLESQSMQGVSQPSQVSPTQLIKPEGASSVSYPQSSQPSSTSSGALIQQFHQLESQSMQDVSQPSVSQLISSSTTSTTKGSDKVRVYYCDQTTAQCLYSVVSRVDLNNKNYYRSLSECQANCKKASYICYRYEYRYSGSGCNYGFQCVPYASDKPCKNECSPSGAPLTGTAQQQQSTQQQTTQQQYYCQNICYQGRCTSGYFSQSCSNMKTCKSDSDCGGVTQPSTNVTYWCTACRGNKCITGATIYPCSNYKSCRTDADCQSTTSSSSSSSQPQQSHQSQVSFSGGSCIRQEGQCPSSNNCLSCPSGYYKKSGGCGGCPGKGYDCYLECCPSR